MANDRTEQATPQRRDKARKDGDILRSRELSSAAGTLAGVLCLGLFGSGMIDGFRSMFVAAVNFGGGSRSGELSIAGILGLRAALVRACIPVGILLAAVPCASAVCSVLQSGGLQISGT